MRLHVRDLRRGHRRRRPRRELNLCVPGGKETSRMLKQLLEGADPPSCTPAATPAMPAQTPARRRAPEHGIARSAGRRVVPYGARAQRRGLGEGHAPRRARHRRQRASPTSPATASASTPRTTRRWSMPSSPPCARRADFPVGDKPHPRRADRGLRRWALRPTCCSN